jgi:hypothetical protein
MTRPLAKLLSLLAAGMIAGGVVVVLTTCGSSTPKTAAMPGTVLLGGECSAYQDCQVPDGKVVECRCTDQSKVPVCVADLEAGEDCTTTGNFSPTCRPGTRCTATDLSLSKAVCLPVAKAGEPCGPTTSGCEDPTFCDSTQHCVVGTADLGQSCAQHAECKAPYVCPWGKHVCSTPAKIGDTCDTNPGGRSECAAGAGCDGSKCVAQKSDGQDCMFDEECTSGLCGPNGCGRGSGASNVILSCGL